MGSAGLVGPTGLQGAAGLVGPTGPAGAMGTIGPQGPTGVPGPGGAAGATGSTGPIGLQGATGAAGTTSWTDGAGQVSTAVMVGIGTASPSSLLDVVGSSVLGRHAADNHHRPDRKSSTAASTIARDRLGYLR